MLKHAYDLRLPSPFWQWNTARPTPLAHCFRFPSAPSAPLLAPPRPEVEMADFIRIPWKLVSICQHMGHSITMWHAQTGYPNDMCSVNLFHLLQKTRWFFPHRPCSRQAHCYCLEWTCIMEADRLLFEGIPKLGGQCLLFILSRFETKVWSRTILWTCSKLLVCVHKDSLQSRNHTASVCVCVCVCTCTTNNES